MRALYSPDIFTGFDSEGVKNCSQDIPLVKFIYLVFTRIAGDTYRRRLRSLLSCLCDVFRALINSPVGSHGLTQHSQAVGDVEGPVDVVTDRVAQLVTGLGLLPLWDELFD